MNERRFALCLGTVLVAGFGVRIAYVLAQPSVDPTFDRPMLDGEYYLEWARSLAGRVPGPSGAYYLAPMYAYVLAAFLAVAGESFALLYLLQQGAMVASAGFLALGARRIVGEVAGSAAAVLFLLYHPLLFFGSRPLGEPLAIFLLCAGLVLFTCERRRVDALAGFTCGAAALARPNLLLVPLFWAVSRAKGKGWKRATWLLAGLAIAILPVTIRNAAVSGHLVPVSSNVGITLVHGNGPGATGTYTQPRGFSGTLSQQRAEATRRAVTLSGEDLDAVEADRWWARYALASRLDNPGETVRLAGRRLLLLVANEELGLDYAPGLDRNPWRWGAPLPFAAILGLAASAVVVRGWRRSGGWPVWGAILACALTPLVFYVSSRYRLPAVSLLCLPAGAGLAALVFPGKQSVGRGRRLAGGLAAIVVALGSLVVPAGGLSDFAEAVALSNRANAWREAGNREAAEADLDEAVRRAPGSVSAWYNRGVLMEEIGREGDAEASYREAIRRDAGHVQSAGNLARILTRSGRTTEAIDVLSVALAHRPDDAVCWTNLVVALASAGDLQAARSAADQAERNGVDLDPGLIEAIGAERR